MGGGGALVAMPFDFFSTAGSAHAQLCVGTAGMPQADHSSKFS
jgi:hypothetical protein